MGARGPIRRGRRRGLETGYRALSEKPQGGLEGAGAGLHLERLEVRVKLELTHVLRSRSRGPEKLAMRRLRGALPPGARKPPGPLSCGGGRVRAAPRSLSPAAPSPEAHLQQDRGHPAGLGGRPVQVPPAAVPAQQLQKEGPRGGQQRGWKRGHQETSLQGSPGLQGHPAQLGALRNPSKHDVGEVGQRPLPAAAGVQPCHLHQQLGQETWDRGREKWSA